MDVKLRKVGNSFVVTVPLATVERLNVREGDTLTLVDTINGFSYEQKRQTQAINWADFTCFDNPPHGDIDPVEYVRELRENDRL